MSFPSYHAGTAASRGKVDDCARGHTDHEQRAHSLPSHAPSVRPARPSARPAAAPPSGVSLRACALGPMTRVSNRSTLTRRSPRWIWKGYEIQTLSTVSRMEVQMSSLARCIRCGGEPLEQCLFCDRCYSVVEETVKQGPVEPLAPWVRRAQQRRLPAKVVWVK